jgi:UDP-glucose:(heptosyl)LPS alpha-1,3-glucosyltransferase
VEIGFCLYHYFPYGGLQRDFLRIASVCRRRGHKIRVYVLRWEGAMPADFHLVQVPVGALTHHRRNQKFVRWMQTDLALRPVDRLVGFNKMPGLDLYYAADPCFEARARAERGWWYRLTPRYRHHAVFERAVFGPGTGVEILMISPLQLQLFQKYYRTPSNRFHLLPPGISIDRRAPANSVEIRRDLRLEMSIGEKDCVVLQVGSGFKTKGLDRTLRAFAALGKSLLAGSRLVVIGRDNPRPFLRLARWLGIADRVDILPGRDDIQRFLLAADILIHPAYTENTGTVLLEAVAAGLPVLTTDVCGYADYITAADAGRVLTKPFSQSDLNASLTFMLTDADARARWSANALAFADRADIYSLPERAADVITQEK